MTKGDVVLLRNDPKDIANLKSIFGINNNMAFLSPLPMSHYEYTPMVVASIDDLVDPADYGINVWRK